MKEPKIFTTRLKITARWTKSNPKCTKNGVYATTSYLLYLSFLDTDPRLLEKQEQQQPTYVALSYINR